MSHWENASAIVTGAASGIGLAIARDLHARGCEVWLVDVDGDSLGRAATELGESAHGIELDVRDADGIRELVRRVADSGRLDLLVNNAGIAIVGEAHELTAAHYDRILDINVRGVTNGIAAAYPLLREQGRGHILNTCSVAGLLPIPLLAAYAMTKHALVGLSLSLRIEARRHGVGISALCPSTVDTPMLLTDRQPDLPPLWRPDHRRFLSGSAGAPIAPERVAEAALRGVERNLPLILVPARARWVTWLYRWCPQLVLYEMRRSLHALLSRERSRSSASIR